MKLKKPNIKTLLYVSVILNVLLMIYCYKVNTKDNNTYIVRETKVEVETPDTIDDWEKFTMALIKVESDYDSTAVSSVGARGYLQLTPIYIKEVNRIHNTNYTFADAWNLERSFEIFNKMQQAHNKDYDVEKAIILHNGKSGWYRRRVMQELRNVETYEKIRKRVKKINSELNS